MSGVLCAAPSFLLGLVIGFAEAEQVAAQVLVVALYIAPFAVVTSSQAMLSYSWGVDFASALAKGGWIKAVAPLAAPRV